MFVVYQQQLGIIFRYQHLKEMQRLVFEGEFVATDYSEEIVQMARENLLLNCVRAHAQILDWEEKRGSDAKRWDLILFADAISSEEAGTLLAHCIDATLTSSGEVIGALPKLRIGIAEFINKMRDIGFSAEEVHVESDLLSRIDAGSVFSPEHRQSMLSMIEGLPASGCILVRWRRQSVKGVRDDSRRIWDYLASAMHDANANIKLSEGFEIWE